MADATETSSLQTPQAESGSLIVGRIRPPMAMWAALEGVTRTTSVRNGVLIIFSENIKGRIGIFCNRYISGAIVEPRGDYGLDAVRELLSIKGGMFGFRACMGNESSELAQSLALDIEELLLAKSGDSGAADALRQMMAPGSQLLRSSDLEEEDDKKANKQMQEAASSAVANGDSTPEAEAEPILETTEGDFSYLDWFAAEMGSTPAIPKFRQILLTALPRMAHATNKPVEVELTPENDLEMYGRLLESEQQKVVRDIELSMERGRGGNGDDAMNELKLLQDFIQSEQARAQSWQGLDEIPTPRPSGGPSGGVASRTSGNIPRPARIGSAVTGKTGKTGEFSKDCDDLLATSLHKIPLPKEFVKRIAVEEEPPPKQFLNWDWFRRPYVVGGGCIGILVLIIFGISSWQSSNDFADCMGQATKLVEAKQPRDAIFVLNKAIEKDPTSGRAYFYRGLSYASLGDYDKASKDFEDALIRGANNERVRVASASAAIKAGKFDEALKDCKEVLKQHPRNTDALAIQITCNERLKNYDEVEKGATTALGISKDGARRAHLFVQRGFALSKRGKHEEASKDFASAIALKQDGSTYMQRGDAYRALKKYAEAADDYSKVLDNEPRNYSAYVARGICYTALHNDKEAMKDFGRALSLDKSGVEALIQRGSLHLSESNYRLAANDLEDAMALCPRDSETQQKLASAYAHLHKIFPRSWLHSTTTVSAGNRSSSSSSMTADAVHESGTIRMPATAKEMVGVGYKYLSDGELQYACQMFAEAIKREPNNVDARRYMAHALIQSGSASAAVSQFDALVSLHALTPRDAVSFAKALATSGSTDRAVDVLSSQIQQFPQDVALRAELIRMYNSIGFASKAQDSYRDAVNYARTGAQRAVLDAAYRGGRGNAGANHAPTPTTGVTNNDLGG